MKIGWNASKHVPNLKANILGSNKTLFIVVFRSLLRFSKSTKNFINPATINAFYLRNLLQLDSDNEKFTQIMKYLVSLASTSFIITYPVDGICKK